MINEIYFNELLLGYQKINNFTSNFDNDIIDIVHHTLCYNGANKVLN